MFEMPKNEFKFPGFNWDNVKLIDHAELNKKLVDKISELESTIIKLSKKNWVERNPVTFAVGMSVISALIAAIISQIEHIR